MSPNPIEAVRVTGTLVAADAALLPMRLRQAVCDMARSALRTLRTPRGWNGRSAAERSDPPEACAFVDTHAGWRSVGDDGVQQAP